MNSSTILKFLAICVLLLVRPLGSIAQQSCYNIIGYLPSWVGEPSAIDYSKYSHINYAFGIPNTNGTINAIENSSKLVDLVNRAHASNTKVLLSVGGWLSTSPDNTPFETIANNSTAITQFVNSCANLITQYNLDGIDIDWEYPSSQTKWNNLMRPLATRVHGMGKLLTAAVPAEGYYGNNVGDLTILDLVNIMSYDCACPSTAPYSQAVDALNYWTGRGVPIQKRILGVPFYSSDNYTALHVQKANLVKTNGGGIMIWDIATYYGDINSIYNTLGSVCKGNACATVSVPGKVEGESYCSGSGVSSEATTDTGGGRNLSSIETNDWAAYKINVPTAGTYNVQYRVASLNGGGILRLEKLGGSVVYGSVSIPKTSGWQTWTTVSHSVQLSAGVQDIALVGQVGGFNVNWFSFSSGSCTTPSQPGTIAGNTSVTAGSSQAYSVSAVSGATSYTWTLPSGWSGSSTSTSITTTAGSSSGTVSVTANNSCGASASRTLSVTVTGGGTTNIAFNKPVTVTSVEGTGLEGSKAVDGNGTTRWASTYVNNQNFVVDLGANYSINRIKIVWEAAYAKDYQIQVSTNNSTWTTIKEFWGKSSAAADDYTGLNSTARWLKVYCINRATQYGFSIFEFEAYGTATGGRERTLASAETLNDEQTHLYPNPTTDKITITIAPQYQNGTVQLYSPNGMELIKESIERPEHTLDLSTFQPGFYIIHLSHGANRTALKVIKK
jgi:chitinase